jgi:hypothetical protein
MTMSFFRLVGGRCLVAGAAVWLALGPAAERPRAQSTPSVVVAVVVHPSNVEDRITSAELCDTLLGERRRWLDGRPIEVLVPPAGSSEWTVAIRAVCRTSEAGFKRQVASSRAFGRASRPPQIVETAADMKKRVAASPRALGFLTVTELDATVKALLIDGLPPTDAKYLIQGPAKPTPR